VGRRGFSRWRPRTNQCVIIPFNRFFDYFTPWLQGRFSLDGLRAGCEAANLVGAMLRQKSAARPPMAAVLAHPAWWPPAKKLAFLVDLSNAMEFQDRAVRQVKQTA